jgi:hypothetical protein
VDKWPLHLRRSCVCPTPGEPHAEPSACPKTLKSLYPALWSSHTERLSGTHFQRLSGSLCLKPSWKPFSGPQALSFLRLRLTSRPASCPGQASGLAAHCGPIEPGPGSWSNSQLSRSSARCPESLKTHKDSLGRGEVWARCEQFAYLSVDGWGTGVERGQAAGARLS